MIIAALAIVPRPQPSIGPTVELIAGDGNVTRLSIEIADTPAEHQYGLMNRPSLAQDAGMLFVFRDDQRRYFWMKDTLIPLDMIFIDNDLAIVDIRANAAPLSEATIASAEPCRYVLEVNGGLCEACGIRIGDRVRLDFEG